MRGVLPTHNTHRHLGRHAGVAVRGNLVRGKNAQRVVPAVVGGGKGRGEHCLEGRRGRRGRRAGGAGGVGGAAPCEAMGACGHMGAGAAWSTRGTQRAAAPPHQGRARAPHPIPPSAPLALAPGCANPPSPEVCDGHKAGQAEALQPVKGNVPLLAQLNVVAPDRGLTGQEGAWVGLRLGAQHHGKVASCSLPHKEWEQETGREEARANASACTHGM